MISERSIDTPLHANIPFPTSDGLRINFFVNRLRPASHINDERFFSSTTKKCLQDTFSRHEARRDLEDHVFRKVCS
jgi:hypothetical protein